MATYTIKLVVAGQDDASPSVRKASDALTGLGKAAKESASGVVAGEQVMVGALRRVGEIATNAVGSAVQALGAFAVSSVTTAAAFEQGMANVGAISGATDAQLATLTATARELGATTSFSASQAAEGMKFLGMAGFDTNEIVAAMPGLLDAAAASGTDLGRTADIVSNILSGFNIQASEAGRVADVMTAAATRANTDFGQLGEAMKYVAPVAAAMGVSLEDATAAVAKMSDAGIQGSMAGTALRGAMIRLAAPTEGAAKAMAKLGLDLFTTEGALKPLPQIIGEFERGMEGMTAQQQANALQTIIGTEAMAGFVALMNVGEEELASFSAGLSNSGGIAKEVAEKQLATFEGRVKIMQSALEGLQITIGSAVLPVLSALAEAATTAIGALDSGVQLVLAHSETIQALAVPALIGLGAATLAYAATQLPVMIAALSTATTGLLAKAAAAAAAVAPFALLAAGVAAAAFVVNDFNDKVQTATQSLLEGHEWWNASTAALDAYNASQLKTNTAVAAAAGTVDQLRSMIESEVESLGRRAAAGMVSDAQMEQEIARINQMRDSLQVATANLDSLTQAALAEAAASHTATAATAAMSAGFDAMTGQVMLTAGEIEKLGQQIEKTLAQDGPAALAKYVATEAQFLNEAEKRQAEYGAKIAALEAEMRKATSDEQRRALEAQIAAEQAAYADAEMAQATSYAAQQAAQRAHLGQMLIDYTVGQAQLGNLSKEHAAAITRALEEEYGLQQSSTASTFLAMAGAIDDFASSSSGNITSLIGTLRDQEAAAVATERAMTEMSKEYVAEAVANFVEKGGEASDYAATLRAIPSRVVTDVVTRYSSEGSPGSGGGGNPAAKARGGDVFPGNRYLVGELGPELFVPEQAGTIMPADQTRNMVGGGGQSVTYNYYTTVTTSGPFDEERLIDLQRTQQLLAEGL